MNSTNTQLTQKNHIGAILLMGGQGQRFNSQVPKQFHRLCGKKIYLHTLEAFINSELFQQIVLVCPKEYKEEVIQETTAYLPFNIQVVEGGTTRQSSSYSGLLACHPSTQIVVIHDAVRPFVTKEILEANIEKAIQYQAVDTCISSHDTLVYAPYGNQIETIPNRHHYLRGQTPQSFYYPLILKAHVNAQNKQITNAFDDCSLVIQLPHPVHWVQGSEANLKITSELDLILAEQLCRLHHTKHSARSELSLNNKIIAITGGTGGIGTACAKLLKEEGALPILISKTSEEFPADLTLFESVHKTFDVIFNRYGHLDGLINCIGLLTVKPFETLTQEEIDLQIETNFTSVVYSCRCAHLKPDGHIINIASSSYTRGRKQYALYSSAKAAIVNFTQGLAEENPHMNINVIVPQRTNTAMRRNNFYNEDLATLLDPQEVAQEIISLLKQKNTTNSIIEVRKK